VRSNRSANVRLYQLCLSSLSNPSHRRPLMWEPPGCRTSRSPASPLVCCLDLPLPSHHLTHCSSRPPAMPSQATCARTQLCSSSLVPQNVSPVVQRGDADGDDFNLCRGDHACDLFSLCRPELHNTNIRKIPPKKGKKRQQGTTSPETANASK
jgi:hypothetical protein